MGEDRIFDIASIGECMVEFRETEPGIYSQTIGGDSFNQVAAASLLGAKCTYLTQFGDDIFLDTLRSTMQNHSVQIEAKVLQSKKNAIYFVKNDVKTGERTFHYFRSGSAASCLTKSDAPISWIKSARVLSLSGITQALSTTTDELVGQAMESAASLGVKVAYDINFRKKLWNADDASQALAKILPFISILFLSEEDLPILQNAKGFLGLKSNQWHDSLSTLNLECTVFRRGSEGCQWFVRNLDKPREISAPRVIAKDTSGAGDVFAGVFLASYVNESPFEKCAELATKVAAKHVQHIGAMPKKDLLL